MYRLVKSIHNKKNFSGFIMLFLEDLLELDLRGH